MAERGDREYSTRLGQVLARRDPEALRSFLETSAARFGDARQVEQLREKSPAQLLELMHRMILARPDLGHLHVESRRWLETRQARRMPRPRRRRGGNHEH